MSKTVLIRKIRVGYGDEPTYSLYSEEKYDNIPLSESDFEGGDDVQICDDITSCFRPLTKAEKDNSIAKREGWWAGRYFADREELYDRTNEYKKEAELKRLIPMSNSERKKMFNILCEMLGKWEEKEDDV